MSPRRPLRPCAHGGCPALVESGRCTEHQQHQVEKTRAADRRRGSSTARGYGARWRRYRDWFIERHPVCACGCEQPSTDVDHIEPVTGPDDPRFWDPTNHQALTHECHSKKTATENGGFGR